MQSLFLTGLPRVGKTTLITKLVSYFQENHPEISLRGFYTEQVISPITKTRIGFDVISLDGNRGILARKVGNQPDGVNISTRFTVGDYLVDVEEFEKLAIPTVQFDFNAFDGAKDETTEFGYRNKKVLLVVDEIGKMESFSKDFEDIIRDLIFEKVSCENINTDNKKKNCCILGTVALKFNGGLAREIREASRFEENVKVWEVTYQNRNNMVDLVRELEKMLDI
ncbi:12169_t:CDS:1 [Acaulospora colombiana]|uniref:12169_t:CDS:1 n=1 Tax=Acaulospora colombiana TaxID=27376 RepID=A0ACA9PL77_9GLOM|nr:12169_t:CDS:1 [Acaulospora colombiana]